MASRSASSAPEEELQSLLALTVVQLPSLPLSLLPDSDLDFDLEGSSSKPSSSSSSSDDW